MIEGGIRKKRNLRPVKNPQGRNRVGKLLRTKNGDEEIWGKVRALVKARGASLKERTELGGGTGRKGVERKREKAKPKKRLGKRDNREVLRKKG